VDLKVAHGADTDGDITILTDVGTASRIPRMRLRRPNGIPNQVALEPEPDLELVEH